MKLQVTRAEDVDTPEGFVCLGFISGVFGVRGEIKIFLYNLESDLFERFKTFYLLDESDHLEKVEFSVRPGAGKKIIGKIKGLNDRNGAEQRVGARILFRKELLPKLEDGEWYQHQLLGLPVFLPNGNRVGEITEIVEGNVEIWVVEDEEHFYYVPNTDEQVLSVDLDKGVVITPHGD